MSTLKAGKPDITILYGCARHDCVARGLKTTDCDRCVAEVLGAAPAADRRRNMVNATTKNRDESASSADLISIDRALDAAHKNGAVCYTRQYRARSVADDVRSYLASSRADATSTVVRLASGGAMLVVDFLQ